MGLPGGLLDCRVEDDQQPGQEQVDHDEGDQRPAPQHGTELRDDLQRRDQVQHQARRCQDQGRGEQRPEGLADRRRDRLVFALGAAIADIVLGEQDAVVDGGAQLDGADDQVADVDHVLAAQVRHGKVQPDGALDGEHQQERDE